MRKFYSKAFLFYWSYFFSFPDHAGYHPPPPPHELLSDGNSLAKIVLEWLNLKQLIVQRFYAPPTCYSLSNIGCYWESIFLGRMLG